jgi:beta-phosphoglucomutase-like phosphatase (HAD superfamily)
MKIRAILFDMDGVLIEAKEWHYDALNRALELFGLHISRSDHLTTFNGLPTRRKLEILTLERDLPRELHAFINELKQMYTMELVCTQCRPLFIHEYALSKLKASGFKIAVCSNSIRQTVDEMMAKANLSKYLDFVISNSEVEYGKPSPEMYQKAMAFFEVEPRECLIVEDNENGIRAARAAGGNLLVVRDVREVNFANIQARIAHLES